MIWGRSGKVQASQTEEAQDRVELPVRSPGGFSEEALKGLADLEARMPPPEAVTEPAFTRSFRMTDRLKPDAALLGSS